MIRLTEVSFSYDGVRRVLDGASLEIGAGLTLVLGPNGCGKTTLLRLAAGVERPDSGTIEVDGVDLWEDEARARRPLAYVPEQPDITPFASLGEVMRLVCRLRGEPLQRAAEALREVGLQERERAGVRQLSSGQRRRALLAAARIGKPRVILLDEPLEALDRAMREQVLAWIEERRAEGAAVILVTHQIEPFVAATERAVAWRGGRPAIVKMPDSAPERRACLDRLARGEGWPERTGMEGGRTMNLKAQQLKPGLWRWTLPHPDWTPDRGKPGGWGQMVGCVSYEPSDTAEPFILFDPLAPPSGDASEESFWKALDADVQRRGTVAVFLANYFHVRSTQTVRERYRARHGAEVWAQADARSHIPAEMTRTIESAARLPGGVTAHPIAGLMEAEVVYHIPEHRALVVADALIGAGEGRLRVPPARWAEETDEGQRRYHEEFRASLRGLLALPIDMVLVSHGEPVLTGGDGALREALEAPAWGEEPARAIPD